MVTQLQLEHVHLVLPEAELRQYDAMLNGSSVLPYFLKLRPFFQARAVRAVLWKEQEWRLGQSRL